MKREFINKKREPIWRYIKNGVFFIEAKGFLILKKVSGSGDDKEIIVGCLEMKKDLGTSE